MGNNSLKIAWLLVVTIFSAATFASEEHPEEEGSSASDPTAKVNFIDARAQFFDLEDGSDRDVYRIDGAYVFTSKFKATFEAHYWDTNASGSDQSGWAEYHLKGIYFPKDGQWGNVKYRVAAGAELVIDGGNTDKGIGPGADSVAPLFGAAFVPKPGTSLIPFAQYFKSFDAEPERDVEQTALRFIALQQVPSILGWVKADLKFVINHENDDKSTTTFEVQVGKMFTPKFGVYVEGLFALAGQKSFDDGIGIAGRFFL